MIDVSASIGVACIYFIYVPYDRVNYSSPGYTMLSEVVKE